MGVMLDLGQVSTSGDGIGRLSSVETGGAGGTGPAQRRGELAAPAPPQRTRGSREDLGWGSGGGGGGFSDTAKSEA